VEHTAAPKGKGQRKKQKDAPKGKGHMKKQKDAPKGKGQRKKQKKSKLKPNGWYHTASTWQKPTVRELLVFTIHQVFTIWQTFARDLVCRGYDLRDQSACDGISIAGNSDEKKKLNAFFSEKYAPNAYASSSFASELNTTRSLAANSTAAEGKKNKLFKSREERQTRRAATKKKINSSATKRSLAPKPTDMGEDSRVTRRRRMFKSRKERQARRARIKKRINSSFKKIKSSLKDKAMSVGSKLLQKAMKKWMNMNENSFKCWCASYGEKTPILVNVLYISVANPASLCLLPYGTVGQTIDRKYTWAAVPGWRRKEDKDWRTRDLGPVLFSIVAVCANKIGGLAGAKVDARKPLCQFDVSAEYKQCYSFQNFMAKCSLVEPSHRHSFARSCAPPREVNEKYNCPSNSTINKRKCGDTAGRLQCRPNAVSCGGDPTRGIPGGTVSRSVSVRLVKGQQLEFCKRGLMFADTITRFVVNMATSMVIETDSREYCQPGREHHESTCGGRL